VTPTYVVMLHGLFPSPCLCLDLHHCLVAQHLIDEYPPRGGRGRRFSRDLVVSTPVSPAISLDLQSALCLLSPPIIVHPHRHRVAEAREATGLRVKGEQGIDGFFLIG
jgi:hypothetical protein